MGLLDNIPREQHAKFKAKELSKRPVPSTFTRRVNHNGTNENIQVTIRSIESTDLPTGHTWLTVIADAKWNGKDLPVDNPLHFQNPPIEVPNGTITERIIDLPNGKKITVQEANVIEDLDEAIKQMVVEAIRTTCL